MLLSRNLLRAAFVFLALALSAGAANAATCFWFNVSGGNYDNANTGSWFAATGGTGGACAATGGIPKNAGDIATFDAASGGNTIVVCGTSTANCPSGTNALTIASIDTHLFTGTMDWATRSPSNVSLSGTYNNNSGVSTNTTNCGTTVFNLSGATGAALFDMTGATHTVSCANVTLNLNATSVNARTIVPNCASNANFGTITVGANTSLGYVEVTDNTCTLVAFNVTAPNTILGKGSTTTTVTAAISWLGDANTDGQQISFQSDNANSPATFTFTNGGAITGAGIRRIVRSGGSAPTANSSFDLGGNTGLTIHAPAAGGGGHIIGG